MQGELPIGPVSYAPPKAMSPSSIGTFDQCPMKFKFSRLDRIEEDTTEPQVRGNYVHEVLELLLKLDQKDRNLPSALAISRNLWFEKYKELFEAIPNHGPANDFQWTSRWCIENYFNMEDPETIPSESDGTVGLEWKVDGEVNGVPMRGIVDRWQKEDDNRVRVIDYKTGKVPAPRFEFEKKMQLMIYVDLLQQELDLDVSVAQLYYVKSGKVVDYVPSAPLLKVVKESVAETWVDVQSSCASGEFETKTGPLCNWCSFKPHCPAWG